MQSPNDPRDAEGVPAPSLEPPFVFAPNSVGNRKGWAAYQDGRLVASYQVAFFRGEATERMYWFKHANYTDMDLLRREWQLFLARLILDEDETKNNV